MAIARTASVTVSGPTGGPYTATQNSAQFGQKVTTTVTPNSTAPNFFTSSTPFVTPGGTVTVSAGGSNNFTSTGTRLGQTGVVEGDYSVSASTDPALPQATSSGSFEGYGNVVGLTYSGFGTWSLNPCGLGTDCTPVYVGVTAGASPDNVETASMPATGGANFVGGAVGYVIQPVGTNSNNAGQFYGTANLHADFDAGSITGGINGINVYDVGGNDTLVGTLNDIGLTATISGAGYSGTTSVTGSAGTAFDITGATGFVSGGFYGPTANETAGVFSLSGGPNNSQVLGSFGAKVGSATALVFTETALPVGTPGVDLTATLATGLSGQTSSSIYTSDPGPNGFIGHATYVTPGGTLVVQSGGANNVNTNATKLGQTGVVKDDYTITSSTDPAITTGGGGNLEVFAGVVGLQYSGFGTWNITPCDNSSNCTPTYVGTFAGSQPGTSLTPNMPTSGTANYTGGATGFVVQPVGTNPNNAGQFYGTSNLTANFATGGGTITGSITAINVYNVDGGTALLGTMNNIGLSGTISGSTFAGPSSVTGSAGTAFDIAGASGTMTGGFYGPNAAEAAGVFHLSGGANSSLVVGSFGAK